MLLFRLVCDKCGAKTNEFDREIEVIIHSEKDGWSYERPDDPAVMGLDYCPKCDPYHDLQHHGPYESDEPEWTI